MSEPTPISKCARSETLLAFHEGRLDSTARREVARHMASCVECRNGLMALMDDAGVPRKRNTLPVVAAALATVAVVLLLTPLMDRWSSRRAIANVADAAGTLETWPIEGRLSGGFPDLPPRATTRAGGGLPRRRAFELQNLRIELEAAVTTDRAPVGLQALGLVELLLGDEERAVDRLSEALIIETGRRDLREGLRRSANAALLSDLSAALLQRAHVAGSSRDLMIAFESADRAWTLAPTREATWNRAAAIEGLGLPADAIEAWQEYLRLDNDSSWRSTASMRLDLLVRAGPSPAPAASKGALETAAGEGDRVRVDTIVRVDPAMARALVENELLPCWAEAVLSGASDVASDCLNRARVIAASSRDIQQDAMLAETVAAIDGAAARQRLAEAHALYSRARGAYRAGKFAEARAHYESAIPLFESAETPFAMLARVYAAGSAYNLNDYAGAIEAVTELLRRIPDADRFPSALGRAHWTAGTSNAFLGHYDAATREYHTALTLFRKAREDALAVSMREMLAGAYEMMGDRDRAWDVRLEALAELGERRQAEHLQQTLAGGARAAQRHGYPALSRLLTRRELAVTRDEKPGAVRAAALARIAQLSRADGDVRAAAHYASLAWSVADRIEEPAIRQFAINDPNFLRGVLPETGGARRLELLREALAFARRTGSRYGIVETALLLSREHARLGNAEAAIAALGEAFESVDVQEQSIQDLGERDLILEEYRSANRDLLRLLIERRRIVDALVQAERNRARTVGAGVLGATDVQTESDLRALQRAIPAGTAVVYYATLDDRILCWLVTSARIDLFQAAVSRERVRAGADALAIARAADFAAAAAEASRWLVDPWLRALPPATSTLVFVTDDETANVPFNALFTGESMLIERFGIVVAPSLAVHIAAQDRERELRTNTGGQLLVVAAVEGNAELNLEPLTRGRREVSRLRQRSRVHVLDGATRRDFLAAAPSAEAIHITTHAITNEEQPSTSALVLQREGDDNGLLYVHEIAGLQLRSTRMVFIAACEAARAGSKGREGTATIGRAFLAAGVPVVIGSTRDLDDSVAAAIVDEFYRRVDAGADPVTALRQTQLSMKGRFASVDWATLQVMGGIASRERDPWLPNWK